MAVDVSRFIEYRFDLELPAVRTAHAANIGEGVGPTIDEAIAAAAGGAAGSVLGSVSPTG